MHASSLASRFQGSPIYTGRAKLRSVAGWTVINSPVEFVVVNLAKDAINKFIEEQRRWIFRYVLYNPLSFSDETRRAFILHWNMTISVSSVWRLMKESNLSYKVRNYPIVQRQSVLSFST